MCECGEVIITAKLVVVCTVQYSTVQYSTVQYSTVQYSTVQYKENCGVCGAFKLILDPGSNSGNDQDFGSDLGPSDSQQIILPPRL